VLLQIGGKWNLRHCLQYIPPLPLFTSTDASSLAVAARVGRWYRAAKVARAERVVGGRAICTRVARETWRELIPRE